MFARVTVIQASPDLVDEGIRQVKEEILPGFQALPGFKGGYFLVNRRRGKVMGVILWETEEAMLASGAEADRLRERGVMTAAAIDPPMVELFEVAATAS
jgi:hypothetical protein